jgi:uncharacterized protein with HEPN domain
MKHPERVGDYLEHIAAAVARVAEYVEGFDYARFRLDTLRQDAVARNIEIIGEAATQLHNADPAYTEAHPEVPWEFMRRMRNIAAHEYWRVDLAIVWDTVKQDLPK